MRLFGGAKKPTEAKTTAAVQAGMERIRETISMLEKREQVCEKKINEEIQKAKDFNAKGRRSQALMALKTKKHYEKELIKISNVKQNLITQQSYLDSASMDVEALKAMKAGADALKASHAGLDARKVEDLMEDIDEQMALKNEVSDAISRPFAGTEVDEDELNAELDALTMLDAQQEMAVIEPEPTLDLPAVPTHVPVLPKVAAKPAKVAKVAISEEDDDFAALRTSMT